MEEFPILTERLLIRPFGLGDIKSFQALIYDAAAPEGWIAMRPRVEDFLAWQLGQYRDMDITKNIIGLCAFDRGTGEVVASVGAGRHDDLGEPELFYTVRAAWQRKGYATEAARAVAAWAFSAYDIPYLIGTAGVNNLASRRVLEKCGFQFVDERELLVHVTGGRYRFAYYRLYRDARI